jgi:poly-gamma-glutamate synthesis protein (capsule biosynthesis protein)
VTTGDMMIGRSVNLTGRKQGYDWSYKDIAPFFSGFDFVVTNLENPLISDCPGRDDGMIFCADAESAKVLPEAKIDLFTLANNHTLNYGQAGLQETQSLLAAEGLASLATGQFYQTTLKGETFGFLAYDDVSTSLDLATLKQEISFFSSRVDYLLIAFHFGIEYTYRQTARQVALAHLAVDAGAVGVIGNHAHWYQPVELYHSGAIIYAHGNLIFDQMWSQATREGFVAVWSFQQKKLHQITLYPVLIKAYGHAEILTGQPAKKMLEHQQEISNLGTIVGNSLVIQVES